MSPAAPIRAGLPRPIEVVLASLGLLACSPLLVLAALLVRLTSPGPALFRQQRVGIEGRLFTLYKFRSMRAGGGSRVTASGDRRVTAIGGLLRATKLDELPELWNILRGDMSFVGPRPEVPAFVDIQDVRWQRLLLARPGLTDPVTLRLRNEEALLDELRGLEPAIETEQLYRRYLQPWKLQRSLDYLSSRSSVTDVGVLLATLRAVLSPKHAKPPELDELLVIADSPPQPTP